MPPSPFGGRLGPRAVVVIDRIGDCSRHKEPVSPNPLMPSGLTMSSGSRLMSPVASALNSGKPDRLERARRVDVDAAGSGPFFPQLLTWHQAQYSQSRISTRRPASPGSRED